jgi:UDP-N-acetyl-D-galactosamine dehydrogenase
MRCSKWSILSYDLLIWNMMPKIKIAIIGLGYVGLELGIALSKHFDVIGYDTLAERINELKQNYDRNLQFSTSQLKKNKIILTSHIDVIRAANIYIITVPTPALFYEYPDLEMLKIASQEIGSILKKNDIVIYESSVYPGTTTQYCIPILEAYSHLTVNTDFYVGYSPERICPSDKKHPIQSITKLISANHPKTLKIMAYIYKKIAKNIYQVSKIEHAEASKMLENIQRDVNIALMNEFTKIMHAMNLNMHEILRAAETKFNFAPFKPGLVGGHCISIDPLYMAFQAKRMGVQPNLIICSRQINDTMTQFILHEMLKLLTTYSSHIAPYRIGIFGITYKENIPDIRNSLVLKFIKESKDYPFHFLIHDPYHSNPIQKHHMTIQFTPYESINNLDLAIIFVPHDFYQKKGFNDIILKCNEPRLIMDIPALFVHDKKNISKVLYWHF